MEAAGSPIRELRTGQVHQPPLRARLVMVFTIRDGMIVRHRHYYDTADMVAAFA